MPETTPPAAAGSTVWPIALMPEKRANPDTIFHRLLMNSPFFILSGSNPYALKPDQI